MSMIEDKELTEFKASLSEEEARGFAGLAWCFPNTRNKTMDPDLALAFAEILDAVVNGGFNTVESYLVSKGEQS